MSSARSGVFRWSSFCLTLAGIGGLILSATVSTHYLETLPKWPDPQQLRMTPRSIHGTVVYQTESEDRQLSAIEFSAVGLLVVGLGLGVVYLKEWGIASAVGAEESDLAEEGR